MERPVISDNNQRFIELVLIEVRKIDSNALFDINYYPSLVRIRIQADEQLRGKLFNKLHHLHNSYGLRFTPTQFIKRDKTIISFDLYLKGGNNSV